MGEHIGLLRSVLGVLDLAQDPVTGPEDTGRLEFDEAAEGILVPDTVRQTIVTGTVLAKGPGLAPKLGAPLRPIDVEVGDRVLWEKNMGTELKSAGQRVVLLRERFLQMVLPKGVRVEIPEPPPPPPMDPNELGLG